MTALSCCARATGIRLKSLILQCVFLQHGNFPIYPVEPIIRHGKDVTMAQLSDDKELYRYTAEQVKHWQKEGLETIAIVCRDEKEAEKIKKKLGKSCPSQVMIWKTQNLEAVS